jgi:hypothetical protein
MRTYGWACSRIRRHGTRVARWFGRAVVGRRQQLHPLDQVRRGADRAAPPPVVLVQAVGHRAGDGEDLRVVEGPAPATRPGPATASPSRPPAPRPRPPTRAAPPSGRPRAARPHRHRSAPHPAASTSATPRSAASTACARPGSTAAPTRHPTAARSRCNHGYTGCQGPDERCAAAHRADSTVWHATRHRERSTAVPLRGALGSTSAGGCALPSRMPLKPRLLVFTVASRRVV